MSQIVKGAKYAKTVIFPGTVRESLELKVSYMSVQSVVLNEGLKTIGSETFRSSKIKRIVISKSVTKIDKCAFENCKNLKEVVFEGGSKLEKIGFSCFKNSGIEAITLPKSLREID